MRRKRGNKNNKNGILIRKISKTKKNSEFMRE